MPILVSVDGLGLGDFEAFKALIPRTRSVLENYSLHSLSAKPFKSAQPVWAEIFTGQPWFKNGCAGYSKPNRSLNKLSVFNETHLLIAPTIFDTGNSAPSVVINVPLLMPNPKRRIWLSDGSMPISKSVSPDSLRQEPLFRDYTPRPFADITSGPGRKRLNDCLDVETRRLQCARELFARNNWSSFLWRLTIFDHLTHLLGLRFLAAEDLEISEAIRQFADSLDSALFDLASHPSEELIILSTYSHVRCRASMNLNMLLAQGGFLKLDISNITESREKRFTIVGAVQDGSSPSFQTLRSMEGRLDCAKTLAASPVSGCVYINRSAVFEDGSVSNQSYLGTRQRVGNFLQTELTKMFGQSFVIEASPLNDASNAVVPEFIVSIDEVEFHDMEGNCVSEYDLPRTTHSSKGFLVLPQKYAKVADDLQPVQMQDLLTQCQSMP